MNILARKGAYAIPGGSRVFDVWDNDRALSQVRGEEMIAMIADKPVDGTPIMWAVIGAQLVLWPRPDADANYVVYTDVMPPPSTIKTI